ncbi:unnamed protein product [Gulo gulo]|uniref:Uncharacterized protein n=1 Tax=Gulo gulo TaxID=48420 RepID=A0A9X9Q9G2_GULGU|nr:unnamed protein product [Gulo gulo]
MKNSEPEKKFKPTCKKRKKRSNNLEQNAGNREPRQKEGHAHHHLYPRHLYPEELFLLLQLLYLE